MVRLIPDRLKSRVICLRRRGYSYHEIKKEVGVSYGSVSRLARKVKISSRYLTRLKNRRLSSVVRKNIALKFASDRSMELLKCLNNKEKHLILASLYWGEGSKTDLNFSNTDPAMISVFISILNETLGVGVDRLRVSIRIYEDMDVEKCISFWSKVTGVTPAGFSKINILTGKKRGKLEYGLCRVRLKKGGDVLKLLNALKQRISEIVIHPYSSMDRAQVS